MKKIRRGSYTPVESVESRRIERMMQMGAELGNGGRVLNLGGGLLAETRKQTSYLDEQTTLMRGWKASPPVMGQ